MLPFESRDQSARKRFEYLRWRGSPACPFCSKAETVKILNGESMGEGWFHCAACRKKFTVRVGTIMERSHIPLGKWRACFHLIDEVDRNHVRLAVTQISQALNITRKSARLMLDRINSQNERRRHSAGDARPVWWENAE
jgi:transposase-like protein